ncbi:MAG: hypothetical protein VZR95_04220 [Alphaproteobacteria bacterium]
MADCFGGVIVVVGINLAFEQFLTASADVTTSSANSVLLSPGLMTL